MKKKVLFFSVVFCLNVGLSAAEPILGFWESVDAVTGKPTSGWEIYEKNDTLYGKIVKVVGKSADEKASECRSSYKNFPIVGDVSELLIVGSPWIYNLAQEDTNEWTGGYIIDIDNGDHFACDLTYHFANAEENEAESLELHGKVGPFGKSVFWKRTTPEEIMTW